MLVSGEFSGMFLSFLFIKEFDSFMNSKVNSNGMNSNRNDPLWIVIEMVHIINELHI